MIVVNPPETILVNVGIDGTTTNLLVEVPTSVAVAVNTGVFLSNLPSLALTASRSSVATDSGAEPIYNATTSNYTFTVAANTITNATYFQQENTGTITLVAGVGVTFVGTLLATTGAGSLLTILPTSTPNRYIIVKGGL